MSKSQTDLFGGIPSARSFEDDAIGFLIKFVRKTKGKPFSAEEVTEAATAKGIAPLDLRAWGKIFVQAAKDGYIRRSDVLFRRKFGNGTLAPGWVSN